MAVFSPLWMLFYLVPCEGDVDSTAVFVLGHILNAATLATSVLLQLLTLCLLVFVVSVS